jgi:hypothetical protein
VSRLEPPYDLYNVLEPRSKDECGARDDAVGFDHADQRLRALSNTASLGMVNASILSLRMAETFADIPGRKRFLP